jgi:hypothetical protein
MAKKKKKKFSERPASPVKKQIHEPTAFELAFREAEAKDNEKPKDDKINDKPLKKTSSYTPKISEKIISKPPPKPLSEVKQAASTPAKTKEKRVYIPPPSEKFLSKKNERRQQPEKKQQKISKPSLSGKKKNLPVKLGLKCLQDETCVLDVGETRVSKEKHAVKKHRGKTPKSTGSAQVHQEKYNDESDIVIGFDFGTSSSKIVIRDSGRQTAYAVPFGSLACSGNIYLIPTNIFINEDGTLSLLNGEHSYDSLKIHLMDNPVESIFSSTNTSPPISALELATAYIALVIRNAREWFLEHTQSIYEKTHIHWHINLGLPSKNYDNLKMRKNFQSLTMAAWRISRLDNSVNIADVKNNLNEAEIHIATEEQKVDPADFESLWLHPDFVNTHPEVIMEVVGYARSPLRTSGLHLLVDIGAATLDAASFIIHSRDGEDIFSLLETKVERYGTMALHNRRIQTLKDNLQKILIERNSIDPTSPLPVSNHYKIQAGGKDISESDVCFFHECSALIGKTIRDTKQRRDPFSRAWEKGLPVFICGGGGKLISYREMISARGTKISSGRDDFKGFDIKEIPKPDQLEAPQLPPKGYDRLAVAYGLSFTSDEIGKVIPQSKISDIHKEVKTSSIDDCFVSKDMC